MVFFLSACINSLSFCHFFKARYRYERNWVADLCGFVSDPIHEKITWILTQKNFSMKLSVPQYYLDNNCKCGQQIIERKVQSSGNRNLDVQTRSESVLF